MITIYSLLNVVECMYKIIVPLQNFVFKELFAEKEPIHLNKRNIHNSLSNVEILRLNYVYEIRYIDVDDNFFSIHGIHFSLFQ